MRSAVYWYYISPLLLVNRETTQVGLTLESVSPKDVVAVAHVLSLIAGLVLFVLGAFRFGFLDNILSRPLLCGFINALAVYIIIEQCTLR